jgi:hypothetical protein
VRVVQPFIFDPHISRQSRNAQCAAAALRPASGLSACRIRLTTCAVFALAALRSACAWIALGHAGDLGHFTIRQVAEDVAKEVHDDAALPPGAGKRLLPPLQLAAGIGAGTLRQLLWRITPS